MRRFVREGVFYQLSNQTLRDGSGSRWQVFLYVLEKSREALLFVFRLENSSENTMAIVLRGLDGAVSYRITPVDGAPAVLVDAQSLQTQGFTVTLPECESAAVFQLRSA